jgi:hypothetical protein
MKKALTLFSFAMFCISAFAQTTILPSDKLINSALIHQGKFEMSFFHSDITQATELGTYDVEVTLNDKKLILSTHHKTKNYEEKNNVIADANSFKLVSKNSSSNEKGVTNEFSVSNGTFTNLNTKKKTNYDEKLADQYFDAVVYPYVLSSLPLKLGFENYILPIVNIDLATNKVTTDEVVILETKSDQFTSPLTGQQMCWKVTVVEMKNKQYVFYYIDKNTRKIRKIEYAKKTAKGEGYKLAYLDKETDVNLFKTKFDNEAIRKMMNDGNSIITGEAFARDDRSGKDDKLIRIDVLNVNKKQFAPKGAKVLLMPNTEYYKEWFELNKKQAKIKGAKPIPLPKEAASHIKMTEVFNDKGNFEFSNLMDGEYLLFTSFNYEDFFSKREVTGKADVYVNGSYQGTEVYTDMFGYTQQGNANFYKFVTIPKNGEEIVVKLKR